MFFLALVENNHNHGNQNHGYACDCLKSQVPLEQIVLLPGETDDAKWVSHAQVHEMIRQGQICQIIANQFLRQEQDLKAKQSAQSN